MAGGGRQAVLWFYHGVLEYARERAASEKWGKLKWTPFGGNQPLSVKTMTPLTVPMIYPCVLQLPYLFKMIQSPWPTADHLTLASQSNLLPWECGTGQRKKASLSSNLLPLRQPSSDHLALVAAKRAGLLRRKESRDQKMESLEGILLCDSRLS